VYYQEERCELASFKYSKTTRHSGFSRWKKEIYRNEGQAAKRPESSSSSRGGGTTRVRSISRRELGIHYSGSKLDSGLFRVVQHRASTQVNLREKTGMTVVRVDWNERGGCIFIAPKTPFLPGEVPEEASSLGLRMNARLEQVCVIDKNEIWYCALHAMKMVIGRLHAVEANRAVAIVPNA
jgi:hypothetical protein